MTSDADHTSEDIVRMNAEIDADDAAIDASQQQVRDLCTRRDALRSRLDALKSDQPDSGLDGDDAIVQALAADPSVMPNEADMADARARRDAARIVYENWEASVSLVGQAIGRLDDEIEAATATVATLRDKRDAAWRIFARAAYHRLFGLFRAECERLKAEFVEPMLGLIEAQARDSNILASGDWRLSKLTTVDIEQRYERAAFHGTVRDVRKVNLFSANQDGFRTDHASHVSAYRERLRRQSRPSKAATSKGGRAAANAPAD